MSNIHKPDPAELPSTGRLLRSTAIAAAVAAGLLVTVVLPAEYAIDPTGVGRLLGLTQIVDSPDNGYARFEAANGVTLSIHADGTVAGGAVTYLESGALDAWCAYLSRRGVRFDSQPRDEEWGWREARLEDPAGNALCLYQGGEYRRFPPWRV